MTSLRPMVLSALLSAALVAAMPDRGSVDEFLPLIGTSGGTSFSRHCPDGKVLTGIRVRTGAVIDGIGILCSGMGTGGWLGEPTFSGTMAGGNGGTVKDLKCPTMGFRLGAVAGQRGGSLGVGIDRLTLICRQWLSDARALGGGETKEITAKCCTGGDQPRECGTAGWPAVGIRGRHGSIVDAVGLVCGLP
jgi:hypothetical protein